MRSLSVLAALLGLAALAPPANLAAQQPAPGGAEAARTAAEVDVWLGELEQLHARLERLQLRALDDPRLTAAQTRLGERIREAMQRADPAIERGLARMEAMEAEAAAAREAGDEAQLERLVGEADHFQRRFGALHARVLRDPEIAADVADFQALLQRRMLELDPDAERVIARFRELETKLVDASRATP